MDMEKVLLFNFEKCFALFTILIVESCYEMVLFRYLSNHVFPSP